jgi:hypothetical protein
MHNLRAERFYRPRMINGMMASADGPIKTFPLRGIKDTPPYLHDGRSNAARGSALTVLRTTSENGE